MIDTGQPIYASSALLFVGSVDVYTFFSTGSDLLPVTAPGGTGTFKLFGLKDNYPAAALRRSSPATWRPSPTPAASPMASVRPPPPSVAGDIVFYTTTTESCGDALR